jgi:hypothetical protein
VNGDGTGEGMETMSLGRRWPRLVYDDRGM